MMPADPAKVLGVNAVVGVEVGDQDLAQVEALLGEDPHHPATAPVHSRRLADDDARLEGIFDVIEAAQAVSELLLQPGYVLPAGLVGLACDDADQLQLVGVVGIHDRLHRPLEDVVRLGVGRNHAEVQQLKRIESPGRLVRTA